MSTPPLLSREQEIELIRTAQTTPKPDATPDEQDVVKAAAQAAMNKLVEHNMGLVYKASGHYTKTHHQRRTLRRLGLDSDELTQQGLIGFVKAIQTFDLTKNCRLATHASWLIRGAISDFIKRTTRKESKRQAQPANWESNIPDPSSAREEQQERRRLVLQMVDQLPAKEWQDVVRLRYGLDNNEMTFKEIAARLHLDARAARKIHTKALKYLRKLLDPKHQAKRRRSAGQRRVAA